MEKTFHMLLYRAFHAQRAALRPHMAELGLGPGQPKLLSYLAAHGPSRQKQLADYFDVDPAAVSRMVEGPGAAALSQRARTRAAAAASWSSLRSRGARPARPGRNTAARWRSGCSAASTRGNGSSLRIS